MPPTEYELREQAAREAGNKANARTPKKSDRGLFAYGDASPGLDCGMGAFLWFTSEKALVRFLRDHITFFSPGPSGRDRPKTAKRVEATVDRFRAAGKPAKAMKRHLNPMLKGHVQIEWIGTLDDLLDGNTPYTRTLRRTFRGEKTREAAKPITPREQKDFIAFLSTYGA